MKQKRLSLYQIDIKYIRNLAKADDHVMSVSPQIDKETRPFVGIVIICDHLQYCIPLSSPKPKHASMKNDIDFMKIMDNDKIIGVLNFNNMIPIADQYLFPLDLQISEKDNISTKQYKKMASKQLDWCQQYQDIIIKRANKLYKMIKTGCANNNLKKRCCDFSKLETILSKR